LKEQELDFTIVTIAEDKEIALFDVDISKLLENSFIFYNFKEELNQATIDGTLRAKLLDRREGIYDNALYLAVEDEDLDYVKAILDVAEASGLLRELLLDKGTDGDTGLNKALSDNNKKIVMAIFDKLFTPSNLPILKEALLVNNDYDISPLHNLVLANAEIFQEIMELASKKGVLEALLIPEAGKQTALHFAVYENLLEVVESINNLAVGVNGLQRGVLLAKDSDGNIPLHWLSEGENAGMANKLMAINNDLLKKILSDANKEGNTAFLDVILRDRTEIMKVMYSKVFASPDELLHLLAISNKSGFSPLRHMALKNEAEFKEQFKEVIDNPSIMSRLLKLKDGAGKTLRDMAAEEENAELALYLNTQSTAKDVLSSIDGEQVLVAGEVRAADTDIADRDGTNADHLEIDISGVGFNYGQNDSYS
jgi:hypothetical protein